jgi:hypothetical protein
MVNVNENAENVASTARTRNMQHNSTTSQK